MLLSQPRLKAAEIAVPAIKNGLTAATVVLTASVNVIPPGDEAIPRLLDLIPEAFRDREISRTALQCCRSLLLASPKTQCDQEIVKYLLPRLVTFVTTNLDAADPDLAQAQSAVCGVLTSFVGTLTGEQVAIAMALVVPTFLARAAGQKGLWRETSQRLLDLVGVDQQGFKMVVTGMNVRQKSFMEEVLRAGAAAAQEDETAKKQQETPTIALKMDFGV